MEDLYKEVNFFGYCNKCKNVSVAGFEEPCHECLCNFRVPYSEKPVNFEEGEKKNEK